jgi:hypothetical protein
VSGSRTLLDVELVEKQVGVRIEHLFAHARGRLGWVAGPLAAVGKRGPNVFYGEAATW